METTRKLGYDGESAAADEYIRRGFFVLERNWNYKKIGEIDLILCSLDGKILVICEVKFRKNRDFGDACERVNFSKQSKIRRLTEIYLAVHPNVYYGEIRFDVASVYPSEDGSDNLDVEIIEDAF